MLNSVSLKREEHQVKNMLRGWVNRKQPSQIEIIALSSVVLMMSWLVIMVLPVAVAVFVACASVLCASTVCLLLKPASGESAFIAGGMFAFGAIIIIGVADVRIRFVILASLLVLILFMYILDRLRYRERDGEAHVVKNAYSILFLSLVIVAASIALNI